jgi:anti-sigma B factor antagonist
MFFGIATQLEGDWVRLSVTGELDLASAPAFRRELRSALSTCSNIVLDLSGAALVDSVGLGLILGARRRAGEADGRFVITGARDRVMALFVVTGLDGILELTETFDPAGPHDG